MRTRLFAAVTVVGVIAAVLAASGPASGATTGSPIPVTGAFQFSAMACAPGTTACVAVGQPALGGHNAVLQPINNGSLGPLFSLTGPDTSSLHGIACPTSTTCYAVGTIEPSGSFAEDPAVVPIVYGGAGTPMMSNAFDGILEDVACANPNACVAVGETIAGGFNGLIAPIYNGVMGTPVSVAQTEFLGGIVCQSSNACTLVGADHSGNGVVLPITDVANLTLGSLTTVAGTSGLGSIACPTSTCIAAGSATVNGPNNNLEGVIVPVYLGGVGTAQLVPGTSQLGALVCTSATTCLAIGDDFVTCCSAVGVVVHICKRGVAYHLWVRN